jgi:hypothetical protein
LDLANFEHNGVIWEKLLRELRSREMPPPGRWRPDPATYQAFVNYIESGRDRTAELKPNPGRPTLHRLNRTEYANAIRDLLAVHVSRSDGMTTPNPEALHRQRTLVEDLGGTFHEVVGDDIPQALLMRADAVVE